MSADRAVWRVAEFGRWMSGKRKGWDARSIVSGCSLSCVGMLAQFERECSCSLGGNARGVWAGMLVQFWAGSMLVFINTSNRFFSRS